MSTRKEDFWAQQEAMAAEEKRKKAEEGQWVGSGRASEILEKRHARELFEDNFDRALSKITDVLKMLEELKVDNDKKYKTIGDVLDDMEWMGSRNRQILKTFLRNEPQGIECVIQDMVAIPSLSLRPEDFDNGDRGTIGGILQRMVDALQKFVSQE